MAGLTLTSSNRLERLCDALAQGLSATPLDPLTTEVVVVQSRGMERWLRLELARRLGVCANVRFPFPNAFLAETLEAAYPGHYGTEPYERDALAWRLVRLLPSLAGEPSPPSTYTEISAYLNTDDQDADTRLYQLARLLSDTYDQYLTYRSGMIRSWEAGEGEDWQARLWRAVVDDVTGTSPRSAHRAALEGILVTRLGGEYARAETPPGVVYGRVSVFGVSVLPPLHLRVLQALSAHVDVDLYLMRASEEYESYDLSERSRARIARRTPGIRPESLEGGNELLSSLGRLGAEFLDLILELDQTPDLREAFQEPGEDTLLHAVQTDILHATNRAIPYRPTPDDESIRVCSCHSATREAEVLRDYLLDLFDRNPDLEPADVLVMTPSIARYGPALEAVFRTGEGSTIPIAVSDRPARQNGLVRTVFRILSLPDTRAAVSELLALATDGPVRERFGLHPVDLELVSDWAEEAGIRWGMDAAHRADLGLPETRENTWSAGLDRLLLGHALCPPEEGLDEALYAGIAPLEGTESRAEVLGALADFVDTIRRAREDLKGLHTATAWPGVVRAVLESFLGEALDGQGEGEVVLTALRGLERAARCAGDSDRKLGVGAVRAALRQCLEEERSSGHFLTGAVTICEMLPMRSVPAQVICLVGMNDDVFPARTRPPAFDLVRQSPQKGDRSRAQSDRYLFLETILSARRALYVSYVGQSIRDNTSLPPAVPVSLLLDYVERATGASPGSARDSFVVSHPLQPFSPRYLSPDEPKLFTYSEHDALSARELAKPDKKPRRFCPHPLPVEDPIQVGLPDLIRFFRNPARHFVRTRLGFRLERREVGPEDREPFVLRDLDRYRIGEELARAGLRNPGGLTPEAVLRTYRARGRLPHGAAGEAELGALLGQVESFVTRVLAHGTPPEAVARPVTIKLEDTALEVALPPIAGGVRLAWRWGRLRATDRIAAWLMHLSGCILEPHAAPGGTVFVATDHTLELGPVTDPAECLERLLSAYRLGGAEPLEFFPESALAFATALGEGADTPGALRKAQTRFEPSWSERGEVRERSESEDPYVRLCFGGRHHLEVDPFAGLATLVYRPLLEAQGAGSSGSP